MARWYRVSARWSGQCPLCGLAYAAGDDVRWRPGEQARHVVCPKPPIDERLAQARGVLAALGFDAAPRRREDRSWPAQAV